MSTPERIELHQYACLDDHVGRHRGIIAKITDDSVIVAGCYSYGERWGRVYVRNQFERLKWEPLNYGWQAQGLKWTHYPTPDDL